MTQKAEFQAVILAGHGQRMFYLVERQTKALLPVANRPLLHHILRWIEQADIRHILVVCTVQASHKISSFVKKVYEPVHAETRIEVVGCEAAGTADALRAVKDQLKVEQCVCDACCTFTLTTRT